MLHLCSVNVESSNNVARQICNSVLSFCHGFDAVSHSGTRRHAQLRRVDAGNERCSIRAPTSNVTHPAHHVTHHTLHKMLNIVYTVFTESKYRNAFKVTVS